MFRYVPALGHVDDDEIAWFERTSARSIEPSPSNATRPVVDGPILPAWGTAATHLSWDPHQIGVLRYEAYANDDFSATLASLRQGRSYQFGNRLYSVLPIGLSASVTGSMKSDLIVTRVNTKTVQAGDGDDVIYTLSALLEREDAGRSDPLSTTVDGGKGVDILEAYGSAGSSAFSYSNGAITAFNGYEKVTIAFRNIEYVDWASDDYGKMRVVVGASDHVAYRGARKESNLLLGFGSGETLIGGADRDEIYSYGAGNSIYGGDGNDYIQNNAANATIRGGAGCDDLHDLGGKSRLFGEEGSDTLYVGANSAGDGGTGDDFLWISGDEGTYVFTGGKGADIFSGVAGDRDSYSDFARQVRVTDFSRRDGDKIDLFGFDWSYVSSHTTVIGRDSVIDLGYGSTLTVNSVTRLQSSDFFF